MSAPTHSRAVAREAGSIAVLATPLSLIWVAALSRWLPPGPAAIDDLVIPAIAFPLVWLACFMTLFASARPRRARWGAVALTVFAALALVL